MPHEIRIGLAICTPIPYEMTAAGNLAPAMITPDFHRARMSLAVPTNYNMIEVFVDGEEVGDARNIAVQRVMEHKPRPKYLFFLDYDVIPQHDAINKLIFRAEHFPDHDIFAGVYCAKGSPPEPLLYEGDGTGCFWDWSIGDLLFNIKGVHMGLTMIRTSLFDKMKFDESNPLFVTENEMIQTPGGVCRRRGTEDLYFCRRVREEVKEGGKILVDTSVLAPHVDHGSRMQVGLPMDSTPVKRARFLRFGEEIPKKGKKLLKALDLGAGGMRREWKGYETFTTDLRPDTKPDYVMDSLLLNLHDNSFDLIASSHHLEHIPRFEQERAWSEIFRVCKPGGRIEHIVPSIEWAAAKVIEIESGRDDDSWEDCQNIFYGAQESHGYARHLNCHYFGYTKNIAKLLAQHAGFVDVSCEDWRDNETLGYNLVIRGSKPGVISDTEGSSPDIVDGKGKEHAQEIVRDANIDGTGEVVEAGQASHHGNGVADESESSFERDPVSSEVQMVLA